MLKQSRRALQLWGPSTSFGVRLTSLRMTAFMKKEILSALTAFVVAAGSISLLSSAQSTPQGSSIPASPPAAAAEKVPVIDGGAGPCSLELSVTADTKPVPAANVKVHIA